MARAGKPDIKGLRQFADNAHFRGFEQELEEAILREIDDRKQKYEDERRNREKKARRKRLKKQASMTS
jgi:hypothetical protein